MKRANHVEIKAPKNFPYMEELKSYDYTSILDDNKIAKIIQSDISEIELILFTQKSDILGLVFFSNLNDLFLIQDFIENLRKNHLEDKLLIIDEQHENGKAILHRLIHAYRIGDPESIIANACLFKNSKDQLVLKVTSCAFKSMHVQLNKIKALSHLSTDDLKDFKIDTHGFFIEWPKHDIHLNLESFEISTNPKRLKERLKLIHKEKKDFGALMKTYREQQGLLQSDFKDLNQRQIRKYENGEYFPSYETLLKICETYHLSVNQYLDALARLRVNS